MKNKKQAILCVALAAAMLTASFAAASTTVFAFDPDNLVVLGSDDQSGDPDMNIPDQSEVSEVLGTEVEIVIPDDPIVADTTVFEWDKSSDSGITVNTTSVSGHVTLKKGKVVLASSKLSKSISIENGIISIDSVLLKYLKAGENELTLVMDDGSLDITVFVTETPPEEFILEADGYEFTWNRNSDTGIVVVTNSSSKNVLLKKGKMPLASSLLSKSLFIADGMVFIDTPVLDRLSSGENNLTLSLREGDINIIVNVVDETEPESSEPEGLTADPTDFTWDRASLKGIAVKTNSRSKSVVIKKGDVILADNESFGVYNVFGRVGIAVNFLQKLDDGNNKLTLVFDDGSVDINVNVTNKLKEKAEGFGVVTADVTEFEWTKGSSEGISFRTSSEGDYVSVRRKGRLIPEKSDDKATISGGVVTLTPAYLENLNTGKNDLTLFFKEGTLKITVNVKEDTVIIPEASDPGEASKSNTGTGTGNNTSPSGSGKSNSGFFFNDDALSFPQTSGTAAAGALAAAAAAAAAGVILLGRKKKK